MKNVNRAKKRVVSPSNKSQEIQDEIFRKMSADRKVEIGSQLWQLAKDLVGEKISYDQTGSKTPFGKDS